MYVDTHVIARFRYMRFEDLLTNEDVLDGLYDMHFDQCTPIQEQAIPPIMEGRDILACAQTGTGKTAAYLLPIINMLSDGGFPEQSVNCLIMAPTRELAQQIDRQLQGFSYFMPVSAVAIYGGTDGYTYEQQRKSLKLGADIVIATPGRLLAHLNMGYVDLSRVSFFVLDEADRMLDMGFYDDIMQIASHLPVECQILLFSATMPPKIQQMASKILKDPVEIKLAVSKPAEKIKQTAIVCYESQKLPILIRKFNECPPKRVIIFSSSKLKVKNLSRELGKLKINVAEMHSDLDQVKRDNVMLEFKAGKSDVIVATDILARGIDIDDIEMVINYDVPREAEDYVHRIGRTARADREGKAITFVSENEIGKLKRIEKLFGKEIPKETVPEDLGETPDYIFSSRKHKTGDNKKKGRQTYTLSKTKKSFQDNKINKEGERNSKKTSIKESDNGKKEFKNKSHRRWVKRKIASSDLNISQQNMNKVP